MIGQAADEASLVAALPDDIGSDVRGDLGLEALKVFGEHCCVSLIT